MQMCVVNGEMKSVNLKMVPPGINLKKEKKIQLKALKEKERERKREIG